MIGSLRLTSLGLFHVVELLLLVVKRESHGGNMTIASVLYKIFWNPYGVRSISLMATLSLLIAWRLVDLLETCKHFYKHFQMCSLFSVEGPLSMQMQMQADSSSCRSHSIRVCSK